jgi:hypothetical protein
MPPDRDHFNGSVNLDDAEPVMREIVSPIPVGLRRIPGGETGDRADWIFFQLQYFLQLPWLVAPRPQPRLLALQVRVMNTVTAAAGRTVSFVSFTVRRDQCEERDVAPLAEPTADPGTELGFALLPYRPAGQTQGTT